MTADNFYFRTEIISIPIPNLKEIIADEMTSLLFDFGQKVGASDPEFDYLVNRTSEVLRNYYPKWKLHYLDECFRKGKLDEYDRGQKVTMKRLECWFKSYNIFVKDPLKNQFLDFKYSASEQEQFAANSRRFPIIIKFRQMRKPEYDGKEWSLEAIEATNDFQNWLKKNGTRSKFDVENLIFTKVL